MSIKLPNAPILQGDAARAIIPQKAPITMVDSLWIHDEKWTVSGLEILSDNLFVEDGKFQEPGLVENIAQTAALRAGYEFSKQEGGEPMVGFIGAIKKLKINTLPSAGDKLVTSIEEINKLFGVSVIRGRTELRGELIVECEMKIFLVEDGGIKK